MGENPSDLPAPEFEIRASTHSNAVVEVAVRLVTPDRRFDLELELHLDSAAALNMADTIEKVARGDKTASFRR